MTLLANVTYHSVVFPVTYSVGIQGA